MYKNITNMFISAVATTLILSIALGMGWNALRPIIVLLENAAIDFIC